MNLSQKIKDFRSQTPDSVASIESSPSQSKFAFHTNGVVNPPQIQQQQHFQPAHHDQLHQQQQQFQQFNSMAQNQPQPNLPAPPPPPSQPNMLQQPQQQQPNQQFYQTQAQMPIAANPGQFQMNPNPALQKGPQQQPANALHQQTAMPPQQQQPFSFQNTIDQQQAFFNQQQQQQQQQQPGTMPNSFQSTSAIQQSGVNPNVGGNNPYSKAPNQSLARPPSTTIYQQGYK